MCHVGIAFCSICRSESQVKVCGTTITGITCITNLYNAYLDSYVNAVVTAINNSTTTATLSTDIAKTGTDFATLQTDVNSGTTAQLKTDVKTYHSDTRTTNLDTRVALKTTHGKTVCYTKI